MLGTQGFGPQDLQVSELLTKCDLMLTLRVTCGLKVGLLMHKVQKEGGILKEAYNPRGNRGWKWARVWRKRLGICRAEHVLCFTISNKYLYIIYFKYFCFFAVHLNQTSKLPSYGNFFQMEVRCGFPKHQLLVFLGWAGVL